MKKRYKAKGPRLRAAALLLALLLRLLPQVSAGEAGTQYIVKYRDPADDAPFEVVSGAEMERLRALDLLEWYEPDGEAVLLDGELQWNLDLTGARTAFARGCVGRGVRIGVVDSGVEPHPDLESCLLPGRNYITDAPDPEDTSDSYGHGTRVASLAAGCGENGQIGVAPGAQIVPLKITDGKSVKISALCRAIYGGVDDFGCQVLNLSLGVQTDYESVKEAVAYAEARGVTVVSAVGNGGTSALYYPAAYETVIGVGAVDSRGTVYSRSNHNESVWLTAPGADVRTAARTGGYTASTGTSFAVPQVSGAAAVLLGADPGLPPAGLRALLARTAADAGEAGYDTYYGYGILDLAAALDALEVGGGERRCSLLPETGPGTLLRNDTDAPVDCTSFLAYYDETGLCRSVRAQRLTLPARGSAELEQPDGDRLWGRFVCETDTMIPLTGARRSDGLPTDPGPDPSEPPEGIFRDVGAAPGVTVEPRGPGLRITLADTEPWAQYVLTVTDAEADTVLYADQRTGKRQTVFDAAFVLPAQRTALRISVGSDAEDFSGCTIPLTCVPPTPDPVPGYVNCLRDAACPLSPFADLDCAAWYHDGVHWALEEGVMNGVGGTRFDPGGSTSRAMLVTMLWRLDGRPEAAFAPDFADVAPAQWYAEAVAWAASAHVVEGYGAGRFGPGDPVTREQLAVILWRYARYTGADVASGDPLGQFVDAEKIAPWALEALRWAVDAELIRGLGGERLSPKTGATRAQTATVLMRLLP